MSWSGGISADSVVNTSTTFTPEINIGVTWHYQITSYTFPKKGLYRIQLYGSSGTPSMYTGEEARNTPGRGGYVEYYKEFEAGSSIYLGCGSYSACSFISTTTTTNDIQSLQYIPISNVYAIAGGGGAGGYCHDTNNKTQYNCVRGSGGSGGGSSGLAGADARDNPGGAGGTQSTGEAYGKGGRGGWGSEPGYYGSGGQGGDGYYGGKGGAASAWDMGGANAAGGGGGSSYVKEGIASQVNYNGSIYTNATSSSGPESGTGYITITFIQEPNGIPTAPSSVWLDKTIADSLGESCTLSWTGATAGYRNTIVGFDIYRNGQLYSSINTEQNFGSAIVVAPTIPNSSYSYAVLTRVTPTRYSPLSAVVTLSTTTKTAPGAPTDVTINSSADCYIGTNDLSTLTISWTESIGGTYNNVVAYEIYKDDIIVGTTTDTSYNLLNSTAIDKKDNNNYVGSYTVIAKGSGGNDSTRSKAALVKIITVPASITVTSLIPEATATDLYIAWNNIVVPEGSTSIGYHLAFMTSSDTEWKELGVVTNPTYTFKIEQIEKGKNFQINITTYAYGSGGSYTPSVSIILSSGRVGFFNMPSPFFARVYDNAANDVKIAVNAFGYGIMSIYMQPATIAEASGNIFTYTLKCKIGNGTWNDIYTVTKAPTSSDYGEQLLYSYNLASVGEGTTVYFYCSVRDNYGSELSSETIPITRLISPIISDVSISHSYKKITTNFSGNITTPNLNDTLTYKIYLGYEEKYETYNTGIIDSKTSKANADSTIDLSKGQNANINTFIGALYDKVITQQYPRPTGKVRIEVYYTTYPQCKAISYSSVTYDLRNDISNADGLNISLTPSIEHPTYFNSGDTVQFNFSPITWTDAAGGTNGANITYSFSDNLGTSSLVEPNTVISQLMPSFSQDIQIVYTVTAKISYADDTSQSKSSSITFDGARWFDGDRISISNAKPTDQAITGNWILPNTLWSSSRFGNLAKVELSLLNGNDKDSPFIGEGASEVLTSFTSKIIPFSILNADLSQDISIRAKAICTNTSGNTITVYSSYYLVRSAAVTMALRKGSLGLNVSGSFNPTSTDSTLYINAKPNGEKPTVVISDNTDQPNQGRMLSFQKGGEDKGSLNVENGYLVGKKMRKNITAVVPIDSYKMSVGGEAIVFKNDILKNDCEIIIECNTASKKINKSFHVADVKHDKENGKITITYYLSHIFPTGTTITLSLHVINLTE